MHSDILTSCLFGAIIVLISKRYSLVRNVSAPYIRTHTHKYTRKNTHTIILHVVESASTRIRPQRRVVVYILILIGAPTRRAYYYCYQIFYTVRWQRDVYPCWARFESIFFSLFPLLIGVKTSNTEHARNPSGPYR